MCKTSIFNLFDLQGNLLKSSRPKFDTDTSRISIPSDILNQLDESLSNRYVEKKIAAGDRYQSSYSYITDSQFKPIAILNLPYFEDDSFNNMELREFLYRLSAVYFFLLIIAVILAYFMSRYNYSIFENNR